MSDAALLDQPPAPREREFRDRIARFSHVRRGIANASLGWRLGWFALLAGIAGLLLLSGWLPNPFLNFGLFLALVAFLIAVAALFPLRRERSASPLHEAFVMESLAGGLNSRLVSALDFLERRLDDPLAALVVERAAGDLRQDFETRVDRSERDRRRKALIVPAVVFLVLGFTPWFSFGRVAANVKDSWLAVRDALFPVDYRLQPEPGRHVRRLGERVAVRLEFSRHGYDRVTMVRAAGDETPERTELSVDSSNVVEQTLTSDVESTQRIHFEFGNRSTPDSTFIFTTAPTLVNMQTELVPPSYTRLLPRTLEGVQPRLLGLPGTTMTLGFTFSKDLESAVLTFDDGEKLPLDVVGRFASANLTHTRPRQASLQVQDIHGLSLDAPLLIEFDVQVDEKPLVFLPKHLIDDMPLLEEGAKLFGFGVRAEDDFGLTRCVLRWQKSTVDAPNTVIDQGEIDRTIAPPQRKAVLTFEKIFESLALKPGDRIGVTVEAYDNRAPERQMTRSRRFSFFLYQEELGNLNIAQLGFGSGAMKGERIPKAQRQTAVKEPEGLRSREQVANEFEAEVRSFTQAPVIRGEFGRATRDYFRLLSTLGTEPSEKRSKGGPAATEPPQQPPM